LTGVNDTALIYIVGASQADLSALYSSLYIERPLVLSFMKRPLITRSLMSILPAFFFNWLDNLTSHNDSYFSRGLLLLLSLGGLSFIFFWIVMWALLVPSGASHFDTPGDSRVTTRVTSATMSFVFYGFIVIWNLGLFYALGTS